MRYLPGSESRSSGPPAGGSGGGAGTVPAQTIPLPYAAAVGLAERASRRRAPERGSSDVTDPAAVFATQSRPSANEIRSGSAPAANVRRTRRFRVSSP